MDMHPNEKVARRFVEIWNARDSSGLQNLFHDDFRWHIAVTEPGIAQMRELRSQLLTGKNLPWQKAIYDKQETITIFSGIFEATKEFGITPHSFTSQDNRCALELVGSGRNESNGRPYNNLYCYLFEIEDEQIKLFREYQDTLLLFDVWVAD